MKSIKKYSIFIIILGLIGTLSFWYYSKINEYYQQKLNRQLEKQNATLALTSKQEKNEEEIFDAKYSIISVEDLSTPEVSKFAQHIYVPLGLSNKELKQNLLHAAKTLKREKHADTVIIFAYRQDDRLHESGYTAGRCIYAPNLTATFDIAEVYSKNKKIYPAATEATINKDNVNLYSRYNFEPSDVITTLRKGTKIMIIEHYRDFATTDIIDIYKVLVKPHKHIGWIMDSDIDNIKSQSIEELQKELISAQTKQGTKVKQEKKSLLSVWGKNLVDITKPTPYWTITPQNKKVATCGFILYFLRKENKLKINILNEQDLKNYAEILVNNVNAMYNELKHRGEDYLIKNISISDFITLIMANLEWVILK